MKKKNVVLVIFLIVLVISFTWRIYKDNCRKKEFLKAIDKICSQYELDNVRIVNAKTKESHSIKGYAITISVNNFDSFYYSKKKEILESLIKEKYNWDLIFELTIKTDKNEYKMYWDKSDIYKNNEKYTYIVCARELISARNFNNKDYILKIIDEVNEYSSFIENFEYYLTSEEPENEVIYQYANYCFNINEYDKGINALEKILEYKDSKTKINEMRKFQKFIGTWTANEYVQVIITTEKFYMVRKPGVEVYVDKYNITINEDNIQICNDTNTKQYEFRINENGELFSNNYSNLVYKKTSQEITVPKEVRKSEPKIGMTKTEVENSTWGKPNKINKTTTKYGVSEQWVYSGYRYLYFDDGILTSIQD